tara:strand:- start:4614 stop:5327 length:714 start_codon:yes stop_codon:yes gene_type:complete
MSTYVDLKKLIVSIKTIMLGYAFDNLQVVKPVNIKINSLEDYFIGRFAYFMCWFVNFCSVREEFWPEEYTNQVLKIAQEYVVEQIEKFSLIKNPIEYRFLCAYINSIKTYRVKCPGKEKARSYLREIIVDAKRTYSVEHDDSLQTLINEIVKFNLEVNDKVWNLPQYIDVDGEFVFIPNDSTEASKMVERRRDANKILKKMDKYIESMKTKFIFENTLKKLKVASPKIYKYRGLKKR